MPHSTILWRRLDRPGHEAARVIRQPPGWLLAGAAVFTHDRQPCCLDYRISCDGAFHTLSARVEGWVGEQTIALEIRVDAARRWYVNGKESPQVQGCIDLDLNFSPSTNLLPVRRLNLAVGQAGAVKAAWLRFPGFNLEPLEQVYRRLGPDSYQYESAGGQFTRHLQVNPAGFVTRYPGFWAIEDFA